jgi:hypothetical protein
MRKLSLIFLLLLLAGCAEKKKPVAAAPPAPAPAPAPAPKPVAAAPRLPHSELPPASAEVIEHCVITKQENANTVSCACVPMTTRIDSKTGHTEIVCKKMKEER